MSFTIETGKETGLVQIGVVPKPLILCALAAINPTTGQVDSGSDTVYLTTTPALGGATTVYNGNTYQAKLQSNPIEAIQAQSPQGYDIPGSINLVIADGDFAIWTNHANQYGWRGGTLTVVFVLWDIPSNSYSTNGYVWPFILDKPTITATGVLTVAGQARQSMTRLTVPNFARQNRCGNTFPATADQRILALTDPTTNYYGCGYAPDQGGPGNTTTPNLKNPDGSPLTDASGNYVFCDYTRSCGAGKGTLTQGCMARLGNYSGTRAPDGDIERDSHNNVTGRFTGDTWIAPVGWAGKQYVNPGAGTQYGFNTPNPATGTTFYNQGYGTQWVDATVLTPAGNPNSNKAECIACVAPVGSGNILIVLVNGVQVPLVQGNQNASDVNFACYIRGYGGRNGAVNADTPWNSQGDPHGSLCWVEIVVPVELSAAGSEPTVQILIQFPQCLHAMPIAAATPSGGNTVVNFPSPVTNIDITAGTVVFIKGNSGLPDGAYSLLAASSSSITIGSGYGTFSGTGGSIFYYPLNIADAAMIDSTGAAAANPIWALMDLCTWGPFTSASFDTLPWWNAAQICAQQISYTDINGNAATHARYRCSLVLATAQRMALAKAVLGVRNSAGIILARNPNNGLLQVYLEQTLADQQPLPINGSNYNVPIPSYTAAGNAELSSAVNSTATAIPLSYAMQLVTGQVIQIGSEMMQVASGTGTSSLNVTRGYNGTTAASHLIDVEVFPCGYLAYLFDGAGSIEEGTFKLGGRTLNDTPNTIAVSFQNSANAWVKDSATTIDEFGYVSSGNQEIEASFFALGLENYDQVSRRSNVELAKALYGNSRFDSGGTELPSFRSSVKASHLSSRLGFIVGINYQQLGLNTILARVLSAAPNTDGEHWDVSTIYIQDAWATDAYGQGPAPFQRNASLGNRPGLPYPWRPSQFGVWPVHDAMFPVSNPGNSGFAMTLSLASYPALLTAIGSTPVNTPQSSVPAQIPTQATSASTGGGIRPGTYLIAITSNGVSGPVTPFFASVTVPAGTNTNTVTISNIVWPAGAALNPTAYAGTDALHMGWMGNFPGLTTVVSTDTYGNPTAIQFISMTGTTGLPDALFNSFLIEATAITIPGAFLDTVATVTGGNVLTLASGAVWITNEWQNRILSLYYRPGATTTVSANVTVASNTSGALTMATGFGIGSFAVGDVVAMRVASSSITASTVGDAQLNLVAGSQIGNSILVLSGTGANQAPKTVQSHTSGLGSMLTIQGTWDITLDATSIWIVVAPSAAYSTPSGTITNSGTSSLFGNVASLALPWVPTQSLYVTVSTCDVNGNHFPERYQPSREIYIPPQTVPSTNVNDGYYPVITPAGGFAVIDLANGLNQTLVLNATPVTINSPIFTGGALVDGSWFTLYLRQDTVGNRSLPTFTNASGAFCSNVAAVIQYSPDANTDTAVTFTRRGGFWIPDLPGAAFS